MNLNIYGDFQICIGVPLIDSSKVFVLGFRTLVGARFRRKRCCLKNKKLDLWLGPWSLTLPYNLDFEPLGPCNSEPLKQSKSSRSQKFFKIGSLKNFAIFIGKHLCRSLVLIKLQAIRAATLLKRDSNTCVFWGFCKIFKNSFFIDHFRWLLLTVLLSTVKLARVSVLWFCPSMCFRFRSKTYTKRCTNNYLLSCEKISLLELIDHVLSISEYVFGKH